jgi:hypothetical protein
LQGYLACTLQGSLQPLMALEEFNAGAIADQKRTAHG